MHKLLRGWLLSAVVVAGCGQGSDPVAPTPSDVLTHDDLLVPIPRNLDADAVAERTAAVARAGLRYGPPHNSDFYLAVRTSALQQRWVWSLYLKELQPGGPNPMTLGTRVVRFRVQNEKLYVFDADDRRATSDIFSPDLIIDAFPIVWSDEFHALPGSGGYVLIDPAAGLNRFSAVADAVAGGDAPVKLETELSFVESFKKWSDGGSFDQIITAYGDRAIGMPGDVDNNEYRLAATVRVNLRRYKETSGFVQVAPPPEDHYFLTDPINVPNTGEVKQLAVHWGFKPGMQPIKWVIGSAINDIAADPSLGGADLFGAMKRGIEAWNDVYGYQVFTASLADPDDDFGDDHVNYLIVDPDVSKGYAYADWRSNPNTGETRGASVYFGGGFFLPFDDDEPANANGIPHLPTHAKPTLPTLVWQDQHAGPPCVMTPPEHALTGPAKLELFIQHVVTHEIGHTLGLRHNFKGSLVPPTSSVMDYNTDEASIAQPTPASYDEDAIHYLYGMSSDLPTQPFCTDEAMETDPNCVQFDPPSATPLADYQIPQFQMLSAAILQGLIPPELAPLYLLFFGGELVGYARAGTPAEATAAWTALLDGVRAPITDPATAPGADVIASWLYYSAFIQPLGAIQTPITDPAVLAAAAADARGILLNSDGVRTYPTRRLVVDALKKAQNVDSYLVLLSVKSALTTQLPTLSTTDRALTRDLIARIQTAISPYFDQ